VQICRKNHFVTKGKEAMKSALTLFALVSLIFAIPAFAGPDLTLMGVNGTQRNGEYDNPYYGSMDGGGTIINIFCDDLSHQVSIGQQWPVTLINGANASGGRFYSSIGQVGYDELLCLPNRPY
jgi:hypothetical protein